MVSGDEFRAFIQEKLEEKVDVSARIRMPEENTVETVCLLSRNQ